MCASIPTAIMPCEFDARPNAVSASVKITPPWHVPLKLMCAAATVERHRRVAGAGVDAADAEAFTNGSRAASRMMRSTAWVLWSIVRVS